MSKKRDWERSRRHHQKLQELARQKASAEDPKRSGVAEENLKHNRTSARNKNLPWASLLLSTTLDNWEKQQKKKSQEQRITQYLKRRVNQKYQYLNKIR